MDRRRERAQVMHPGVAQERLTIGRLVPPDELAWCIDYCWWVVWDTPEPYAQEVIPRPAVHVAAEPSGGEARLLVTGVATTHFQRKLEGRGRTVALAFRPAGFRPFTSRPASELVDVTVAVDRLLGAPDAEIAALLLDPSLDIDEAGRELLSWFNELAPEPDSMVDELALLVGAAECDRTIWRAEQLAALAGVSLRTLQRRFREYVGPGPKWVVQRCRLLDVAEAAHQGGDVDWSALAVELGYSDQSHLIRHFRSVVGGAPGRYAEQQRVF